LGKRDRVKRERTGKKGKTGRRLMALKEENKEMGVHDV
jgi:hypothetical protein